MANTGIFQIVVPLIILLCVVFGFFLFQGNKKSRINRRIARVTNRKAATQKAVDVLYLRRKAENNLPIVGNILKNLSIQAALHARLERAGVLWSAERYAATSLGTAVLITGFLKLVGLSLAGAMLSGILIGIVIPHYVVKIKGAKRIKKFLLLFPDAIEFIVRGLRSGLPVTESMNMVAIEMQEPIRSIFFGMGEMIRLGVPIEKTLVDTALKLDSTEFNFFVTSIILQRETGGNLSEILSNLADVLRKRFMMRMKIKALASEAKASAIIVGALPFVVILALAFISPQYLTVFVTDIRGNLAAAAGMASMGLGMGIMFKMTQFEI